MGKVGEEDERGEDGRREECLLPMRDANCVEILGCEFVLSAKVCLFVIGIHGVPAEVALTEIAHVSVEVVFDVEI